MLYFWNYEKQKVTFISMIPHEPNKNKGLLFGGICSVGSKIFLLPYNSEKIVAYDVEQQTYELIKVEGITDVPCMLFISAIREKNVIYCMPSMYDAIIKIDIDTMKLTYIKGWKDLCLGSRPCTSGINVNYGRKIIIPLYFENAILFFNKNTESWEKKVFDMGKKGFDGYLLYEDWLYIWAYNERELCRLNLMTCKIEKRVKLKFESISIIRLPDKRLLLNSVMTGEQIICDLDLNILKTRMQSNEAAQQDGNYSIWQVENLKNNYIFDAHGFFSTVDESGNMVFRKILAEDVDIGGFYHAYIKNNSFLNETEYMQLRDYILGI